MSSPEELTEAYAKGQTKATLEFGLEQIKRLIIGFKNKDISFLENSEILEVRKNYSSGEMKEYKRYIQDKGQRRLIAFGMSLRKITDLKKREDFRKKILTRYKTEGLHIVQFVENGLLNEFIAFSDKENLSKEVNEFLKNIEKYVLFIQATDDPNSILEKLKIKIHSNEPYLFIISCMGPAIELLNDCEKEVKIFMKDYKLKKISDGERENFFFRKISN